tara:strand:- start:1117 stop:1782 length:666 start_codon:yes stop_codon:yes gene_type:complete
MNNLEEFIKDYTSRSRHHTKLIDFIYPELNKIKYSNILEFGVSNQAMSTELFLEYAKVSHCKLFSVDNIDYKNKFIDPNWKFIHCRDDDFSSVKSKIPSKFNLILLDTIHEAKHVEKIIYAYYDSLEVNHCFFIDDISWLPYLKNSDKNRFYAEVNNYETFNKILEIYFNNQENIKLEFNFHGTGMCKIKKINNLTLNKTKKIVTRLNSIKNILRVIFRNR